MIQLLDKQRRRQLELRRALKLSAREDISEQLLFRIHEQFDDRVARHVLHVNHDQMTECDRQLTR